jgi:hypothetical protein
MEGGNKDNYNHYYYYQFSSVSAWDVAWRVGIAEQ